MAELLKDLRRAPWWFILALVAGPALAVALVLVLP